MHFKNKTNGVTWHITDKNHIKRLENDSNFVKVEPVDNTKEPTKNPANNTAVSNAPNKKPSEIDWQELRKLASNIGINTHGKKRNEIESEVLALQENGDANVKE